METFYTNGVHGAIILDQRRKKKNDLYPVRYRITYNRKQLYVNSGFDMSVEEWEKLPATRLTYLVNARQSISNAFAKLKKDIEEVCRDGEYDHAHMQLFLRKGKQQLISKVFEDKIRQLEADGQPGTEGIYHNAKTFIAKDYPRLRFQDVTVRWLQQFERDAIKGGLTYSTLSIYLRCLRALFNETIYNKMLKESSYPFARSRRDATRYRIKEGTGTKVALTVQQVKTLAEYTPTTRAMKRSRDLFLLSFLLAGINFKDMLLLRWDYISGNELRYQREKTKNTNREAVKIRIPLLPVTMNIIDAIGNTDSEYILPYMIPNPSPSDVRRITLNILRQTNRHLLKMGKELGISGLSTMVARHSFATIMKNSGKPVAFISEMLGHKSISTTTTYLKKFGSKQSEEYFSILNIPINGN